MRSGVLFVALTPCLVILWVANRPVAASRAQRSWLAGTHSTLLLPLYQFSEINKSKIFAIMGQEQSRIPSYHGQEPGVYRIVNASAGAAISILSHGINRVETWELSNNENQKWFVQRSGDGHTFQNRKHYTYIAVGSTDIQAEVHASEYPTTWELLKQGDHYLINKSGNDRVLDLHWGKATNGNKIFRTISFFCNSSNGISQPRFIFALVIAPIVNTGDLNF
ncbi:hypothetical protein B0J17DRAFT_184583 [Rhizoctonia solani]|nr:hypothetical protein B0J17DRAFT_184583 [Rhizoctonia solani]